MQNGYLDDARRVEQDELVVVIRQDAQDAVPRRLRLLRDRRQLLPQQRVQQRALPGVGPPHQRHIACIVRKGRRLKQKMGGVSGQATDSTGFAVLFCE